MRLSSALGIFLLIIFGCANPYSNFSDKETDPALFEDARKLVDAQKYTEALAKFDAMGAGYKGRLNVREVYVGALAGRCGLEFIPYFTALSDANLGSATFFEYLMAQWGNKAVSPDHCRQAEAILKSIWRDRTATASEQLFMAVLSMVKMGVYVRYKADITENNGLGDGTVDAGFVACPATPEATRFTDADIDEITTGFALFLLNITSFAATLSGNLNATITAIQAACSAVDPNPCAITEAENVTAGVRDSMRDLLESAVTGVGACADPTVDNCCP